MAYTKVQWRNNQSPPINADNLNHIEEGIYEAHQTMAENSAGCKKPLGVDAHLQEKRGTHSTRKYRWRAQKDKERHQLLQQG